MITNSNERMSVGGGFLSVEEFYGLSTDTKPTNTANGSTFFEMDTGKMYRFNFSGTTWTETTHYGSDGFGPAPSGGGSTGGGVLVLHMDNDTGALDKTWQEIVDADSAVVLYANGSFIFYAQRTAVIPAAFGVVFTGADPDGNNMPLSFQAASADDYPAPQGD